MNHGTLSQSSRVVAVAASVMLWAAGTLMLAAPMRGAADTTPLTVPKGTPVLVDGTLANGEWRDAAVHQMGEFARLYAKQADDCVLLAIELTRAPTGSLDLFLAPADGRLYDLHSSAKLGEKTLEGAAWREDWTWWNQHDWVANVSRFDTFEPRHFLDQPVREFQIRRARFRGDIWRIRAIQTPPDWQTTVYPTGSSPIDPSGWLTLRLQ
jgi:hypothetical protein